MNIPKRTLKAISLRAKADSTGRWTVTLPALPKRTVLKLTCSDGKTSKTIDDVVFGELWLCSGQSNMEWNFNANTIPADHLESAHALPLRPLSTDHGSTLDYGK